MRPEAGRIVLETMDEVRIAERGILLYHQVKTKDDIHNVSLARDEADLPIALSHNRTRQVRGALEFVMQNEVEVGPLNTVVAKEWKDKLDGPVPPSLEGQADISIKDLRSSQPQIDPPIGTAA